MPLHNFEHTNRIFKLRVSAANVLNLDLEGVRFNGSHLTFDKQLWSEHQADIAASAYLNEGYSFSLRSAIPSGLSEKERGDALRAINARTGAGLKMEDVYIFRRSVLNTSTSNGLGLRVLPSAMQKFKADAPGLSRNMNHNFGDIVGKVVSGDLYKGTINGVKGIHLVTTEYIMRRDVDGNPINSALIAQVNGGVYDKDSVTIYARKGLRIKREDHGGIERQIMEIDFNENMQGFEQPTLEEVSFVYNGEVTGAGAVLKNSAGDHDNEKASVSLEGVSLALWDNNENGDPVSDNPKLPSNQTHEKMTPFYLNQSGVTVSFNLADGEKAETVAKQVQNAVSARAAEIESEKDKEIESLKLELQAAKEETEEVKDILCSQMSIRASVRAALMDSEGFDAKETHKSFMSLSAKELRLRSSDMEKSIAYHNKLKATTAGGSEKKEFADPLL